MENTPVFLGGGSRGERERERKPERDGEWKGEHPFCTFIIYLHISLRSSWRTDSTKREAFDTFFAPLEGHPCSFHILV
jgi:hypothetical protein